MSLENINQLDYEKLIDALSTDENWLKCPLDVRNRIIEMYQHDLAVDALKRVYKEKVAKKSRSRRSNKEDKQDKDE